MQKDKLFTFLQCHSRMESGREVRAVRRGVQASTQG
jgi:hypothetical protein